MFMCAHVYDVALYGNTVRNVALGLWLVGHRNILIQHAVPPDTIDTASSYNFCYFRGTAV